MYFYRIHKNILDNKISKLVIWKSADNFTKFPIFNIENRAISSRNDGVQNTRA